MDNQPCQSHENRRKEGFHSLKFQSDALVNELKKRNAKLKNSKE